MCSLASAMSLSPLEQEPLPQAPGPGPPPESQRPLPLSYRSIFFHDVILSGFIPIDSFFMKNHESGSVILRSLPQVKSQNRRRGNAIPAWHGPLFFQFPAMGIAQLFHKPPPQLLPGLHGRTQQRPVKGAAQSVWSLSGTAGGNGFQQILPCPEPRRRPGRSYGARAPCGRWTELFLLCSCPYCRLRLFPGQDPFPAVHPGREDGFSRHPAPEELTFRQASGWFPGAQPVPQRERFHPDRSSPSFSYSYGRPENGCDYPQESRTHRDKPAGSKPPPVPWNCPPASSAAQPEKRRTIFPYPSAAPLRSPETSSTGIPVPPRKLYGCAR